MDDLFAQWWQLVRNLLQSLGSGAGDVLGVAQTVDPGLRALLAGLAALLEANILTGLFVPGDSVVVISAAAVASPGEGVILGLSVAVGAMLGEVSGYALGRWLGAPLRRSWLGRRVGPRRWVAAEQLLDRRGGAAIVSARFLPVFRTVIPFVVGVSGFPFRRFLAWAIPACAAWAALYVTVFSIAAAPLRDPAASLLAALAFAALGLTAFVVVAVAQRATERTTSPVPDQGR